MARIPFPSLVERFVLTLERAGATVLVLSPVQTRPARLRVITGDTTTDCVVFLWTITPGGGGPGVRPSSERRIQITNSPPFPLQPHIRTIVGGWDPETGVWAFWDPRRHGTFSPRSPSLQTSTNNLEAAGTHGIGAQMRPATQGREVTVAVTDDYLLWYVAAGASLHDADTDADSVAELIDASPEEEQAFLESAQNEAEAVRRVELVQTIRAFRDARFRPAVLRAYSHRCAVCGTALKLVDAAHIVPVTHPQGTDDITNGLALCLLHHAAYDTALIGVRSDLRVVVNTTAVSRLIEGQLHGGLDGFRQALPPQITIPAALEVRPDPAKLRLGMEVRQFPPLLIA